VSRENTHSTREHFSRRLVVQAQEENDLSDGSGDSAVHDQIALLEGLDDFGRWSLGYSHDVEAQDSLHVPVTV
jgi:hypothetical protein